MFSVYVLFTSLSWVRSHSWRTAPARHNWLNCTLFSLLIVRSWWDVEYRFTNGCLCTFSTYIYGWLWEGGMCGEWGSCRCEWLGFFWEPLHTRGFTNLTRNNSSASFRLRSDAVKVIRRRVLLWENITSGGAVAENIMQCSSFSVVNPRGQQKHLSPPEVTR